MDCAVHLLQYTHHFFRAEAFPVQAGQKDDRRPPAAKQKAAALEQEYQAHLQSIKAERDSLLRDATVRAQKREEDILNEARSEAASIRAAAEADIAQERKKAVNDLKNEIGGMAVEIAGKVVEREINEADHQALIDEFIRNVGDAS